MAKKCTNKHNARAESLFCQLKLLFCDVLVSSCCRVCISSLIINHSGFDNKMHAVNYLLGDRPLARTTLYEIWFKSIVSFSSSLSSSVKHSFL